MVQITIDLVRKKAEHHDGELAPLREISLHQEGIERIEYIQRWCPKLQILLLQSNLISKIENLNRLKELEYLNLAINNIERIENLERCESLNKLDLTLNFIGELTSVENLKHNFNLQSLFLHGNPCTDYSGYRQYVIAVLPQLETLDGEEIKKSERIVALQNYEKIIDNIRKQQEECAKQRAEQKIRVKSKLEKSSVQIEDEESLKKFWNEKSEHCPETRIEIEKRSREKRGLKQNIAEKITKERTYFAPSGRPYNINDLKLNFTFDDANDDYYVLELQIYKHLETSLLSLDLQPFYIRVTIKGKIFQLGVPEEISIDRSTAERSQTSGHLVITLVKMKYKGETIVKETYNNDMKDKEIPSDNTKCNKRELLEIGPSKEVLDFTKMTKEFKPSNADDQTFLIITKEKIPPAEFEDDIDVPPLV